EQVTLRELHMKLVAPFETSMETTALRRVLLVEAVVEGVTGWGECVAGETPSYSPETSETAWHILRDHLWPTLKGKQFGTANDVWELMAWVRGHNMAKAGLEAAIWDAEAKRKRVPLAKLLGGVREAIASGVSIGIKPSLEELLRAVEVELEAGYQRIKIKIKPGYDLDAVEYLRNRLPGIKLMVDANSAYTLADAARLKKLDQFYLMMIEQPLGWDDLYAHVELQRELETPICLDECIHTEPQAEAAVRLGACRIMNIKLGRVGGYTVARKIHDLCERNGVPVWCGGMLESGIGRAQNIALSALPNFTLPVDDTASRRDWAEDIIRPEVTGYR